VYLVAKKTRLVPLVCGDTQDSTRDRSVYMGLSRFDNQKLVLSYHFGNSARAVAKGLLGIQYSHR
jgi:hypothetical protein